MNGHMIARDKSIEMTIVKCNLCMYIFKDGNMETMSATPQRGFGTAAWNKLQRDLNSPSASCRVRAIRAMK